MDELPSWRDPRLGTMKRAGLWLITEVGEGATFTKNDLRSAFPETSQIDRRLRDLRDHGWQIDTSREDASLDANEQRFRRRGEPVWEPGKGKAKQLSITGVQRREIMMRDGHLCRSCGIAPGEPYPETYENAQLDIARREVRLPNGKVVVQPVLECKRCRVGGGHVAVDLGKLQQRVARLTGFEHEILAGWVSAGSRQFSELEAIWAEYRALPAEARDAFERHIHGRDGDAGRATPLR